jgi:hypothetical protein
MAHWMRLCLPVALAASAIIYVPASAGEFDPILYELREGSVLVDDCLACDRAAIEVPLRGTLVVKRLPVRIPGNLYDISWIDFRSADPGHEYAVSGTGSHYRRTEQETETSVDLEIKGQTGIHLASGTVEPTAVWPAIDVTVVEDGQRDPLHLYRIRIIAEPRAESILYELVEGNLADRTGTIFVDDCRCGRPTIEVPMGGSFFLLPLDVGGPSPFNSYLVIDLQMRSVSPMEYGVTGSGRYRWGGEVAVVQEMDLAIEVNGQDRATLVSGPVAFPEGVSFPAIDIPLDQVEPKDPPLITYSVHLVAKPAAKPGSPAFRRGDGNADGSVDLSDAVFGLLWLFSGGLTPDCLDAADANADRVHDLTDAVFTLDFLFQSGPPPPAPGSSECGTAEDSIGCESYAPCAA